MWKFQELLENNPSFIATVREGVCLVDCKPNVAVVADVKVLDEWTILIAHNEMKQTPENIRQNPNVVLMCFNSDWRGVRVTGEAEYYAEGKNFEIVRENFETETTKPKGAIVVKVKKVEEME